MTISINPTRVIHAGNDVTDDFTVPFQFREAASLVVTLIDVSGAEILKTLSTDYDVSGGASATGIPATGDVSTTSFTPATGEFLVIERLKDTGQDDQFLRQDPLPSAVIQAALDDLAMRVQELAGLLGRVPRLSILDDPDAPSRPRLADPVAGEVLVGNAAGDGWDSLTPSAMLENDANGVVLGHDVNVTVSNTVSETTLFSAAVPAGAMGDSGHLFLDVAGLRFNDTGGNVDFTFNVKIGGVSLFADTDTYADMAATGRRPFRLLCTISNQDDDAVQHAITELFTATESAAGASGIVTGQTGWDEAAVDTSAETTVVVTVTMNTASANARVEMYSARLVLRKAAS